MGVDLQVHAGACSNGDEAAKKKHVCDHTNFMTKSLSPRELFKSLGSPTKIVAPMVDHLELAWRILSRRYGATLCYTPMFHARLFAELAKYRHDMWGPQDGGEGDRPTIVQFCANDPDYLLAAAKLVQDRCDAVDLNLGCPQGIARKGHYGLFLMEDWPLISKLISTLHKELTVPVTAKIRVYDDWEKSVEYAKMVLAAGAQFVTIHGRTREMKGQKTGLADWTKLRYVQERLPEGTVFFANGNILYPEDVERCMEATQCHAVMLAEGNLYNPGVFWTELEDIDKQFPRVDKIAREYLEIVKLVDSPASVNLCKSHLFKLLRPMLARETGIRDMLAKTNPAKRGLEPIEEVVVALEAVVAEIYKREDIAEVDVVTTGEVEAWGGSYKKVPYWRCQPYFRKVNGVDGNERFGNTGQKTGETLDKTGETLDKAGETAEPDEPTTSTTCGEIEIENRKRPVEGGAEPAAKR